MEGRGLSTPSHNPGDGTTSQLLAFLRKRCESWEGTGTFLSKKEAVQTPSESKNKTFAWDGLKKKKKRLKVTWESHS